MLDYAAILTQLNRLAGDTPIMLEHLTEAAQYDAAAAYVRGVASAQGLSI